MTKSTEIDSLSHGVAGGLSGLVSMTLTYPLVSLSTKAQTTSNRNEKDLEKLALERKSILQELKSLKGLYSGLESALVGIIATNFSYYYFYELTSSKVKQLSSSPLRASSKRDFMTIKQSLLCGTIAGIISRILTNPIWIANTRLTISKSKQSTISMIISIVENEGWLKLFNGLSPALALVSNPVIQYTIFEQLKNLIQQKRKMTPLDALYLGAVGKLIATIITYPYITIRSRMHMNKNDKKLSMLDIIKDILINEGVWSFYKGLNMKLLQSVLSAAFLFYFKEEFVLKTDLIVKRLKASAKLTASRAV